MPAAPRGRTVAQPRAAAGRSAVAAPASPGGKGRRMDTPNALADAAAEVAAAEGDITRKEEALMRVATEASLSKTAHPAKATKTLNGGGDSPVANCEIREPSGRIAQNENAKALEAAARKAADAVREKEQIQFELDKMIAQLKAAEQGSGGRKPQNKPKLSNGELRVKKVKFCGPITGCEKIHDALLCRNSRCA